jgi:uncharacterized protein (TIGR03032 family)
VSDRRWARQDAEWRDPAQVAALWREASEADPDLLRYRVRGRWREALAESHATLLVSREYEHLLVGLSVSADHPLVTYMRLPHPSGLAVHPTKDLVNVASTRNPNQVFDMVPVTARLQRLDMAAEPGSDRPLVPVRSRFLPGSLYLHDLAYVAGTLHANAVGHNAVVTFPATGGFRRVWWPRSIEAWDGPIFGRNHLQLNSIAAGSSLATSRFSASAERPTARRPGHRNFPVDRRGVIFDGETREAMARGLTRPHSARMHGDGLWVDNSGYGELCKIVDGRPETVVRMRGWTRGLTFRGDLAFVGTSRVIPRFRAYAPGLDVDASECGIHAVDTATGMVLGSLIWTTGNQVFGIEAIGAEVASGFAFRAGVRLRASRLRALFYAFDVNEGGKTA